MKKVFKWLLYLIGGLLALVVIGFLITKLVFAKAEHDNLALLTEAPSILSIDGQTFRDLNKNGNLDPYEDTRLDVDTRTRDLVNRMNLEEKAGAMFITMLGSTPSGETMEGPNLSTDMMQVMMPLILPAGSEMIAAKKMNNFNIIGSFDAEVHAKFANYVQGLAERTRLGIPITLATDPRHGVSGGVGVAITTPTFSVWPGFLGMAATRDTQLIEDFGEVARQEYRAIGLHMTLSPMADLATEPRWGRTSGTFGEDADLASEMLRAYIRGFQGGDSLNSTSVACMAKHFAGSGTNPEGWETHFAYGKNNTYSGDNFEYHVKPFKDGALAANSAQIMTSYGIPVGQTSEDVAVAFNKEMVTGLLRDSLGFEGVVCTDWNVIVDSKMGKVAKGGASAWGVEELTPKQRLVKALGAGIDQFGGENCPELIVELVEDGTIAESRLDASVLRIMRDKFTLGLFDDPFVDEAAAGKITGNPGFCERGIAAQRKSTVLLKNDGLLPLKQGVKIYLDGYETAESSLEKRAVIVSTPQEADVIVAGVKTPFDPREDFMLESFMHQGRLTFNAEELAHFKMLTDAKPTVFVVNLERAAILTPLVENSKAMICEFDVEASVIAEQLFGEFPFLGKLPIELPRSQAAVEKQLEDLPYDSENPLFEFGFGLTLLATH